MTQLATPLAFQMEEAYLEYRRACYFIIYRHAQERGLLTNLVTEKTVEEISEEMGFLPERRLALELFLKALARFGALTVTTENPLRYQTVPNFAEQFIEFDHDLIAKAIGKDKVDELIHSKSYAGIIDTLYEKENKVASDFVSSNIQLWNEFLQQPFYQYCRESALRAIAGPESKVLDLAAGPGFGLLSLGATIGRNGQTIGLERSRDFVQEAIKNNAHLPQVHIMQADLDEGFPFLRDAYFDSAMIVGAFHFLEKRDQLFEQVTRVLKPGGKFCVAYTYMSYGSYDQELMDLRFLLREPPSHPPTRKEMLNYAQNHGLQIEDEFTMGCFGSFLFRKGD